LISRTFDLLNHWAMNIIFFMIGVSLLMALGFLGAFFWSMKTGQQDDLYTPSLRMLLDDEMTEMPVTPETEPTVH